MKHEKRIDDILGIEITRRCQSTYFAPWTVLAETLALGTTHLPNKSLLMTTPTRSFPNFHHHDVVKSDDDDAEGSIDSCSDRGASNQVEK